MITYSEYRNLWDKSQNDYIETKFPLQIDLDLYDGCNLNCPICHQLYRRRSLKTIPWELIRKLLDEGSSNSLCSINIGSSSEPLIEKGLLLKTVEYAKKVGIMEVRIHTNGLLLDKEFSIKLLNSGIDGISVSIDSASDESYKKVRGSFLYSTVVRNTLRLIGIKIGLRNTQVKISVSFCVTPDNFTEIDGFKKLWLNRADEIRFQDYHVFSGDFSDKFKKKRVSCSELMRRIMVWPDGVVSTCCGYREDDVILGNLNSSTIKEIWSGEKIKILRDNLFTNSPINTTCKLCLNRYFELRNKL